MASFAVGPSVTNKPSDIADAFVVYVEMGYQTGKATQRLIDWNGIVYSRFQNSGGWTSWTRLDNFGCNTAAELASLLGGIVFKDVYNKNFDIDTLTLDGVSYLTTNARISLTDQLSATWSGTYPSGLSNAGAQILHFGLGSYKVQLFCAQNGFASRINFGAWKNWTVYKP